MTLIELLVALGVSGVVAGATLGIAMSTRGMFDLDQHRTTVNQNLRSGIDLLGIDIRQAGERLPLDAPAVQIIDGTSGAPDSLTLRRHQLDYALPVCADITAGTTVDSIFVAEKRLPGSGKIQQGCIPVPDEDSDGWPDNLQAWRAYRIANGGSILAYIHNPVTDLGEFFTYDTEDSATFFLHKDNADSWVNDYPANQEPRVYILDQRTFRMNGEILQLLINDDESTVLNLVSNIRDFQVQAYFTDGSITSSFVGKQWTDLESIEVTLVAGEALRDRDLEREVTTHFFPRHVLSN